MVSIPQEPAEAGFCLPKKVPSLPVIAYQTPCRPPGSFSPYLHIFVNAFQSPGDPPALLLLHYASSQAVAVHRPFSSQIHSLTTGVCAEPHPTPPHPHPAPPHQSCYLAPLEDSLDHVQSAFYSFFHCF